MIGLKFRPNLMTGLKGALRHDPENAKNKNFTAIDVNIITEIKTR